MMRLKLTEKNEVLQMQRLKNGQGLSENSVSP